MQKFRINSSSGHSTAKARNAKPANVVDYRDALRVIHNSMAGVSVPESIQAELPAIASHWLQSRETPPLILGRRVGEIWQALLSTHIGSDRIRARRGQSRDDHPESNWKIDFSSVPFPPVERPRFNFIDLFAGIGGFRIALQSLGGKCVFSSELDRHAQQTYERNFGEVPFGDIRRFTRNEVTDQQLARLIPDHDILAAGFPCQPFSKAGVSARESLGRKHGFSCEIQGTLFFDLVRIAKVKRPKVLLLENVRHLQDHDKGRTLERIKKTIEEDLKYTFWPQMLDASTLVPQRRKRYYMVCFRDPCESFIIPPFTGDAKPLHSILDSDPDPRYTISSRLWTGHKKRTIRNLKRGTGFTAFVADPNKPANTLVARYYKDGKECLIHQQDDNPRKLTPRECAKLQGFPDTFRPSVSDRQAYKQFGNAVVVPVVTRIAQLVIKKLKDKRPLT